MERLDMLIMYATNHAAWLDINLLPTLLAHLMTLKTNDPVQMEQLRNHKAECLQIVNSKLVAKLAGLKIFLLQNPSYTDVLWNYLGSIITGNETHPIPASLPSPLRLDAEPPTSSDEAPPVYNRAAPAHCAPPRYVARRRSPVRENNSVDDMIQTQEQVTGRRLTDAERTAAIQFYRELRETEGKTATNAPNRLLQIQVYATDHPQWLRSMLPKLQDAFRTAYPGMEHFQSFNILAGVAADAYDDTDEAEALAGLSRWLMHADTDHRMTLVEQFMELSVPMAKSGVPTSVFNVVATTPYVVTPVPRVPTSVVTPNERRRRITKYATDHPEWLNATLNSIYGRMIGMDHPDMGYIAEMNVIGNGDHVKRITKLTQFLTMDLQNTRRFELFEAYGFGFDSRHAL